MAGKFTTGSTVVEAVQFTIDNIAELCKFVGIPILPNGVIEHIHLDEKGNIVEVSDILAFQIKTANGIEILKESNWVVKDKKGILTIVEANTFTKDYKAVK